MYLLKENIDLTINGQVTDKVRIENGKLIINDNRDIIELRANGWFINNIYQGKDAIYPYKIENPVIVNNELFNKIFEKEISNDNN